MSDTLTTLLAEIRELSRKQDLIISHLLTNTARLPLVEAQELDLGKGNQHLQLTDRIETERLLAQVRDTVIPNGEDIDFYARMVIDLGAHLLRDTILDINNAAVNRGFRYYVYEDRKTGYLVILVPDLAWTNRVNTKYPNQPTADIFTALVFTRFVRPSDTEIDQVMEEILYRFHACNRPNYTGISCLSDFKGVGDLKYPCQGLNYEQPILNLGFHPHHYMSFVMRALVAPTYRYTS